MLDELFRLYDKLKEKMPKPSELIVVENNFLPFPDDGTFWMIEGAEKDSFIMDYQHWLRFKELLYQNDLMPENWPELVPLNGVPVIFSDEYAIQVIKKAFDAIPPSPGKESFMDALSLLEEKVV